MFSILFAVNRFGLSDSISVDNQSIDIVCLLVRLLLFRSVGRVDPTSVGCTTAMEILADGSYRWFGEAGRSATGGSAEPDRVHRPAVSLTIANFFFLVSAIVKKFSSTRAKPRESAGRLYKLKFERRTKRRRDEV